LSLSPIQTKRYARQLFLDEVGRRGQERFAQALVRVLGHGISAEEAATYLCAAGVGALLLDSELSHRIGEHLKSLNPDVRLSATALQNPVLEQQPCLTLTSMQPDTRLTGAMGGLTALMELLEPKTEPPAVIDHLNGHAMAWFPKECCGLLVDNNDMPLAVLVDNKMDEVHYEQPEEFQRTGETGYFLDPREILLSDKRGEKLVGIFHSHVRVGAYFSQEDKARALAPWGEPLFPDVEYIVLDAQDEGVVGYKVFVWSEAIADFVEQPK
jgi:proteasome lid subunit RPN8/RPN11